MDGFYLNPNELLSADTDTRLAAQNLNGIRMPIKIWEWLI